jgi:hypothetical protein
VLPTRRHGGGPTWAVALSFALGERRVGGDTLSAFATTAHTARFIALLALGDAPVVAAAAQPATALAVIAFAGIALPEAADEFRVRLLATVVAPCIVEPGRPAPVLPPALTILLARVSTSLVRHAVAAARWVIPPPITAPVLRPLSPPRAPLVGVVLHAAHWTLGADIVRSREDRTERTHQRQRGQSLQHTPPSLVLPG